MKRSIPILAGIVVALLLCVFTISRAQTIGDDLAIALNHHGMDAVTSPIAAAAIEIAIANNQGVLDRITALETATTRLSAAPADFVFANTPIASSGLVMTAQTGDSGGGMKLLPNAGQWYDYTVVVPVAGNYLVSVRMYTANESVHFEYPAGTNISGSIAFLGSAQTTITGTQVFALPAGTLRVRLVVDSAVSSSSAIHWFQFTKQ